MDWKKTLRSSTEVWTGLGLIAAGLTALCLGVHGILALALAPFGSGLILSDVVGSAAQQVRSKVRFRRDKDT